MPATSEDQMDNQWNAEEVARLEEEIDQLRSTAAWAFPQLAATREASLVEQSRGTLFAASCPQTQMQRADRPAEPLAPLSSPSIREPSRAHHAAVAASNKSPDTSPMINDVSPRGRPRNSRPLNDAEPFTDIMALSPVPQRATMAMSPTPQISCGQANGYDTMLQEQPLQRLTVPEEPQSQVSGDEVRQLVQDLEALELALQKSRAENTCLRNAHSKSQELWDAELEQLRAENASLRESKQSTEDTARRQVCALREEKETREAAHARDIAELEGMLEPLMEENRRLSQALAISEARLEEATVDGMTEPEIEISCDTPRVLKA